MGLEEVCSLEVGTHRVLQPLLVSDVSNPDDLHLEFTCQLVDEPLCINVFDFRLLLGDCEFLKVLGKALLLNKSLHKIDRTLSAVAHNFAGNDVVEWRLARTLLDVEFQIAVY